MSQHLPFEVTISISRTDEGARQTFNVPVASQATRVLDALLFVREHLDPSVGFRFSCRAGMCGSCAVVINGKEALACQTAIASLNSREISISPLRALPVIRDLVTDMAPFFKTFKSSHAALKAKNPDNRLPQVLPPGSTRRQLIERQNGCVTCGACYSACEWSSSRPGYLGPAALNRVLMLALDERDEDGLNRLDQIGVADGALRCHGLGNCSVVCPIEIPLSEGMDTLKGLLANVGS